MLVSLQWLRSPYRYLDHALVQGRITFRQRLPMMGDCLLTGDPSLVGEIVKNRQLIGGRGTEALRPVVGDYSLIALEGPRHEAHRSILLPLFFSDESGKFQAITQRWTERELRNIRPGEVVSGSDWVARITLNAIVEMMFGSITPAEQQQGVQLVEQWMRSFRQSAVLFLRPLHIDLGALSPWGRFVRNRARVHAYIKGHLERLRRQPDDSALSAMARARPENASPLTDDEIVSEAVTFLLFGHDTSAAAMGWVFAHLLREPDALAQAQAEIAASTGGNIATIADAHPFVRSIIQESMRLTPVVVHLTRHALADTSIGGHAVKAGTRVLPCMYLAHRNPEVFERPNQFVAARFVNPDPRWRHSYFPFGLGTRLCAGMPSALRQMMVILISMLTSSSFELVEPENITAVRKMVLIVPSGGPLIRRLT